ncbi:20099_t:CDS:2 [Funneliformis geosporum]|uniref:12135_t:CDS:1 n=1 Tax=Funneliformis geosporum TaxID=1117311 RepID=A0A9W4SQ37_9GLOM|nr:20099_t:CDS:2 [Funneliformis geosporum]CAI2175080.1 12135_t:CDS:2 [Funneliformis geosporum]
MSTSRALNDEEVDKEMKKMVTFIEQEAIEKAREIKVKADEEFNIEKAKLVRQESINIEATFQRKIKQAEIQKKITQSNIINKSRLKLLQARQQLLNEVFNDTRSQLSKVSQDQTKYEELLKNLILQGLFQLMDEQVKIIVRKKDQDLAKNAIQAATKSFKESTKKNVEIELDKESNLSDDCAGGVVLSSHFGRIRINNTLEERLLLSQEEVKLIYSS